jgi:hypothetical protein
VRATRRGRAQLGLGGGGGVRVGDDLRSGMTCGTHGSATAGRRRRGLAELGELGRAELGRGRERRPAAQRAAAASVLGCYAG